MEREKIYIGEVVNRTIHRIESSDSSERRRVLAVLRNSVNKGPSSLVTIWPLVFSQIPKEFLGDNQALTSHEKVIIATLQLYALSQQGSKPVEVENEDSYYNFGKSLGQIKTNDNVDALDRNFIKLISSSSFDAFLYYLRHMVSIVHGSGQAKINFAVLADDLFGVCLGYNEKIRIKWAKSYFRVLEEEK